MLLLIPLSIKSSAVVFNDRAKKYRVTKLFFANNITPTFIGDAIRCGDIETVQYLLLVGITPTDMITSRYSVYSYAESLNKTDIVHLLKPYLEQPKQYK